MEYAGFGRRMAAWAIDFIFVALLLALWLGVMSVALGLYATQENFIREDFSRFRQLSILAGYLFLMSLPAVPLLYAVVQQRPAKRATWGQRIVGLRLSDLNGDPVLFRKRLFRSIEAGLSALALFSGFLFILGSDRKQAAHDKISGTVVVKKESLSAPSDPDIFA